jgi:hypothetical protein
MLKRYLITERYNIDRSTSAGWRIIYPDDDSVVVPVQHGGMSTTLRQIVNSREEAVAICARHK